MVLFWSSTSLYNMVRHLKNKTKIHKLIQWIKKILSDCLYSQWTIDRPLSLSKWILSSRLQGLRVTTFPRHRVTRTGSHMDEPQLWAECRVNCPWDWAWAECRVAPGTEPLLTRGPVYSAPCSSSPNSSSLSLLWSATCTLSSNQLSSSLHICIWNA